MDDNCTPNDPEGIPIANAEGHLHRLAEKLTDHQDEREPADRLRQPRSTEREDPVDANHYTNLDA